MLMPRFKQSLRLISEWENVILPTTVFTIRSFDAHKQGSAKLSWDTSRCPNIKTFVYLKQNYYNMRKNQNIF